MVRANIILIMEPYNILLRGLNMTILRTALLTVCLLSLGACACGRSEDFTGSPYLNERTAGSGQIDEGCFRRAIF